MFKCNEKGWMREELIIEQLRKVLDRRKRGILGFDPLKGHLTKCKLLPFSLNTDLIITPGVMTSQSQVLQVATRPEIDSHHPKHHFDSGLRLHGMTYSPEQINRGFQEFCMSNDSNGYKTISCGSNIMQTLLPELKMLAPKSELSIVFVASYQSNTLNILTLMII